MGRVDLGHVVIDSSPHPLATNPDVPKSVASGKVDDLVTMSPVQAEELVGFKLLKPRSLPGDLSAPTAILAPAGPRAVLFYRGPRRVRRGVTISQSRLPAASSKKLELHVSAEPASRTVQGRPAAWLVDTSEIDGGQTLWVFVEFDDVLVEVAAVGLNEGEVLGIVASLGQQS